MVSNNLLRRAVHNTLMGGAVAAAATSSISTVNAQADSGAATSLEEVIVTGTRIEQPGLESISPVVAVTAEEIKAQGTTRIEDMLNNLPQVFADLGGNLSNGSTGTASVDLRGLGAQRTLVLINGRRLMPGDPTQNANAEPDLNQIPAALVERVDVLTGGASAVYGADAVAGVVNFVMNDHFEGVRIDANYTVNNHHQHQDYIQSKVRAANFALPDGTVNDGKTRDVTFILGGNFGDGKGNATAYIGYRKTDPVPQSARDFSACNLGSSKDDFVCAGSSTSSTGGFYDSSFNKYTIGAGGQLIPFSQGPGLYNFAPTNYYQRSDERYTAGLFSHYEFNEHATAYTEFSFMHDETIAQVAPSGAFLASGTAVDATGTPNGKWLINCDNPLMSASVVQTFCVDSSGDPLPANATTSVLFGRRNVEGGPRQDDFQHTSFRFVIGSRGEINDVWKYDVYGLYGKTIYEDYYTNDVSKSRVTNALQVVTDPLTGQIVCKANANAANGAPGCVPYDIWNPGGVTPEAVAYISVPSFKTGSTDEKIFSGSINGDLTGYGVKLPTATTGLGIAIGAEYRQERMRLKPDIENLTNDLAGTGNPVLPIDASLSVKEIFTEARLPILQDMPFAKILSAETGYRYSDYDLGFETNTYKFGVDWAPVSDVRLRASYQRAVRAPNLQELYLGKFVGNDGGTDPCATSSSSPATATLAQCARTGVTAGQYNGGVGIVGNPAGQYNGQFAGNPNLKPEQADTYSFGIILTPSALPAFNLTLDYFNIKVNHVIDSIGSDNILNYCLNGYDQFCSMVHRSSTGSLWTSPSGYIDDPTLNLGSKQTKGIDLTSNYVQDLAGAGQLTFNLSVTYLDSFVVNPAPGVGKYDCAGLFGNSCNSPRPKWRHKLRATWATPVKGLDVSMQWRHTSEVKLDTTSSNPLLTGAVPATDAKLGSRDYLDLSTSYVIYKGLSARLGINNVLDKDPPIIAGGDFGAIYVNGNTYPQIYDTLGRYIFLNLTADF